MIRGLAIETSGRLGSIAITEDGAVIAADAFSHGLKHAAEMVPRIDRLYRAAGWKPADAREIYVSVGPGSFTGLRIGITLAKTLAFATGAGVVAVPTVEVLARNAPPEAGNVIVLLDAKRDQIFTARLQRTDSAAQWTVAQPAHLGTLTAMLVNSPRPVWLLGEGVPYHAKFVTPETIGVMIAPEELWRARAEAVVEVGYAAARAGQFIDPQALSPLYIRKPEAEEKREARENALGR